MKKAEYQSLAESAGLHRYFQTSWELYWNYGRGPAPKQHPEDLIEAYYTARDLSGMFRHKIEDISETLKVRTSMRPQGIKSPNRILEKMKSHPVGKRRVPNDILGSKLTCKSIQSMYEVASKLPNYIEVVHFSDRVIRPHQSGYRDLQFLVMVDQESQHIAEVKIVHEQLDALDQYEHRIYEITREITAEFRSKELSPVQQRILEELARASDSLYAWLWKDILSREEHL